MRCLPKTNSMSDLVSSLPSSGGNRQHEANPCSTAAALFFFLNSNMYSGLVFSNVVCFLFRFLGSASLKTWWVTSKLSKPTGDRRGERGSPAPSTQHTKRVTSTRGRRAEKTFNSVYFATELSSTYALSHKEFTSICQWHLNGGEDYPTQTKQSTFCLPLVWDFNPNIQRTILPTS